MTLGHLDIMKRASRLCDKLIVGVAINRGKNPLFPLDERVEMVEHVVAPFRDRIEGLFRTLNMSSKWLE